MYLKTLYNITYYVRFINNKIDNAITLAIGLQCQNYILECNKGT